MNILIRGDLFFTVNVVMNKIQKTLAAAAVAGVLFGGYAHAQLLSKVDRMETQRNNDIVMINSLTEKNESLISENNVLKQDLQAVQEEKLTLEEEIERRSRQPVSRGNGRSIDVEVTAYTLGGNTATGFNLSGRSREDAMVIAVDPNVIPLGTQVYIEFDDTWSHYNGVYTASDTGGAINGHVIDIFVGHGNDGEAMQFGRRTATVNFI